METKNIPNQNPGLTVTLDQAAIAMILEGLALLPLGRVKNVYEALLAAAQNHWDEPPNAT